MKKSRTQRIRRKFTPEYRQKVVDLIRRGDRSVSAVCRDLDLTDSAVRRWVQQADEARGGDLVAAESEREELRRLRAENRVLREERDILVKAAAFV
ncbi:MAG: hypothetical protein CSB44_12955 [Gammaproteobacteria bacterium]|nr:MAG: hypothetical protein CSB44_12955 [Gammaproteobacteria bacterium]